MTRPRDIPGIFYASIVLSVIWIGVVVTLVVIGVVSLGVMG